MIRGTQVQVFNTDRKLVGKIRLHSGLCTVIWMTGQKNIMVFRGPAIIKFGETLVSVTETIELLSCTTELPIESPNIVIERGDEKFYMSRPAPLAWERHFNSVICHPNIL